MDLNQSVIAITGGARGLGLAIAKKLGSQGAHVVILDMHAEGVKDAVHLLQGGGVKASGYALNVANESEVMATFQTIADDLGQLNGVVNNAGITRDGLLVKTQGGKVTDRLSLSDWNAVMNVNLTGVFLCGREAATHMINLGCEGAIINISSIARAGNVGQSNYSATKAGVAAMAVTWANELGRYGIRAAAVAPGFMATEMIDTIPESVKEAILNRVPLRRLGQPAEVASMVALLFENDFLNGRIFEVDGGLRI